MDALGIQKSFVIGHDWGSNVAWFSAFRFPQRFFGVVGLSVPFMVPLVPVSNFIAFEGPDFYIVRFQKYPDAEILVNDIRSFLIAIFETQLKMTWGSIKESINRVSNGEYQLPNWISEEDIDVYAEAFLTGGITAPINWYRCMDLNHELLSPELQLKGSKIEIPSFYIGGLRDMKMFLKTYKLSSRFLQQHLGDEILDAGHFMQEEKPEMVNSIIRHFCHEVLNKPKL